MAGDVVAGDVEEQQVVEAGEEVWREEGERVVLEEQLLQVGALLEDGGGQGGQVVVREVEVGQRPEAGQRGWGEDREAVSSQVETREAWSLGEVAWEEAGDLVEAQVEGLEVKQLADVAAEADLGHLDDVVPAQVETLEGRRVAECSLGQTPDVVVREVEHLELVQVAQRLRLQLHRHAPRPLRVVTLRSSNLSHLCVCVCDECRDEYEALKCEKKRGLSKYLDDERCQRVKTVESSCWHELDLAELDPQLLKVKLLVATIQTPVSTPTTIKYWRRSYFARPHCARWLQKQLDPIDPDGTGHSGQPRS